MTYISWHPKTTYMPLTYLNTFKLVWTTFTIKRNTSVVRYIFNGPLPQDTKIEILGNVIVAGTISVRRRKRWNSDTRRSVIRKISELFFFLISTLILLYNMPCSNFCRVTNYSCGTRLTCLA